MSIETGYPARRFYNSARIRVDRARVAALIKKLLNMGAAGIAVPHASRDNCAAALCAVRYAPKGDRGACAIVRSACRTPLSTIPR